MFRHALWACCRYVVKGAYRYGRQAGYDFKRNGRIPKHCPNEETAGGLIKKSGSR